VVLLNASVAVLATVVLGGSYVVIYLLARRRLVRNGVTESRFNEERAQIVNEGFGAIKEILVLGKQRYFRDRFEGSCAAISRTAANTLAIAQSPRYVIECVTGAG